MKPIIGSDRLGVGHFMRKMMIVGVLLAVLVAGCGRAALMNHFASQADQQAARGYIDLLRQHKFDQIEKDIDPSIKTAKLHDTLVKMAAALPAQNPMSVKIVSANTFSSLSLTKDNLTFEYQFPDRWMLINVALQKKNGVSTIIGFRVNALPDSLENINRFSLGGKNIFQYAVLVLSALAVIVSLYALVLCARTRIAKRKWLWILFILLGVGKISVNWTTGQWGFMPLSIQLFSVAAFSQLYGPWIISVSFPLGAVWFLLRRKQLAANPASPALPESN